MIHEGYRNAVYHNILHNVSYFNVLHLSEMKVYLYEVPERAFQRAHFGTYQRFFLDNVHCQGTESLLLQCRGNSPGVHNCVSTETAGVRCQLRPGGING